MPTSAKLLLITRAAVVASAALSILLTMLPAIMSNVDPDGSPNPFSTEYGGILERGPPRLSSQSPRLYRLLLFQAKGDGSYFSRQR